MDMSNKKKPKYKIGDTVVVTMYGTVGKVTNLKWLDGMYVYEINRSEGLYLESSLEMLADYQGDSVEREQIDIEYKFFIGDLVQVKGYGNDLFRVIGFRTEIWRYKEDAWEDVIYELARINDGEWLEANEDELVLIADAESAETFIQKLGLLYSVEKKKPAQPKKPKQPPKQREKEALLAREQKKEAIDGLLDLYNDYQVLYEMFKDIEYLKVMRVIVKKLKQISSED